MKSKTLSRYTCEGREKEITLSKAMRLNGYNPLNNKSLYTVSFNDANMPRHIDQHVNIYSINQTTVIVRGRRCTISPVEWAVVADIYSESNKKLKETSALLTKLGFKQ